MAKKKSVKEMTNVEFVTELMEFSRFGALAQMFVVDALTKWSDIVAEADPEKFNGSAVNGNAWVGVAKEIKEKLTAKYGG